MLWYVILGAIASIAILVSVFMGSGNSSNQSMNPERANVLATQIISDFGSVSNNIFAMQVGGVSSGNVVFNGAPNYGATTNNPSAIDDANANAAAQLFSPAFGRLAAPRPNKDLFDSSVADNNRVYLYRRAVVNAGASAPVGTGTGVETIMLVGPINVDVCRQVNRIIAQTPVTTAIADSALLATAITGGSTPQLSGVPASIGTFVAPAVNSVAQTTGCVSAGAGSNFAYTVLVSN